MANAVISVVVRFVRVKLEIILKTKLVKSPVSSANYLLVAVRLLPG